MTGLKQQKPATAKSETGELADTALSEATGGIIAVLHPTTQAVGMCDGSVKPGANTQTDGMLIGLLRS